MTCSLADVYQCFWKNFRLRLSTQTKHFFQITGNHLPNHTIYFIDDSNTFTYPCENLKFHIDKDTNSDACTGLT